MIEFARAIEHIRISKMFVFPVGLSSFFELDSMANQDTHESLVKVVDELSQGFCIAPFQEHIGLEIAYLRARNFTEDKNFSNFLFSPIVTARHSCCIVEQTITRLRR
ncbi:hypothetical protein SAMN05421863_100662 [Nitrosomonas communis]|uniref:Uncharacterized protein n=1 Tax=Nitrosomonas communis TaxID=44574 RepID=A0A1I4LBZ0_9PROT|nr:hypothetical protein SAMN05421863_100662 [Nitrosomonas communis]